MPYLRSSGLAEAAVSPASVVEAPPVRSEDAALHQRHSRRRGSWLAAQLEEGKPKGVIASLDGVRAFACLTVMAYHISLMTRDVHLWSDASNPLVGAILLAGGAGVTLFFVLSGFLLFLPYARALLFAQPWPGTRLFYLRRVLRIIPGYYFSLFVIVMLSKPEYLEPQHWKDVLLFPIFLMDSTQSTYQQINGPYWTLAVEWQFYLLLPLIALGIRLAVSRLRPERRFWAVVGCLLVMIGWGLFTRAWGSYFMAHPTATFLVPRSTLNVVLFFTYGYSGKYLEDFAVGMLAGLTYTFLRAPGVGVKLSLRLRRLSPWFWVGGVVLLLFMAMQHYSLAFQYSWPVLPNLFRLPAWLHELGFALGFGVCILVILFGPTWLRAPFAWAPVRWIGLISYSLYIWHLPLLYAFAHHIGPSLSHLPDAVVYSLYWVWALVVVIPFSYVLYILIEKPGMRLSDWLRDEMTIRLAQRKAAQHCFSDCAEAVPLDTRP